MTSIIKERNYNNLYPRNIFFHGYSSKFVIDTMNNYCTKVYVLSALSQLGLSLVGCSHKITSFDGICCRLLKQSKHLIRSKYFFEVPFLACFSLTHKGDDFFQCRRVCGHIDIPMIFPW